MTYLADILTFSRFILATIIGGLALGGGSTDAAFILFMLAELTDAFDGTCARKWPFKKGHEPKYRRYAVKYDMWADAWLWFVAILYLTLRVNCIFGLILLSITVIICLSIEMIVYGKLFGHPDDCANNSLCRRNFPLAKKLIMGRRYFYLTTLILAALAILLSTSWSIITKIAILGISLIIGVFLWFFLKQRRTYISRNATKLEEKLAKKRV